MTKIQVSIEILDDVEGQHIVRASIKQPVVSKNSTIGCGKTEKAAIESALSGLHWDMADNDHSFDIILDTNTGKWKY